VRLLVRNFGVSLAVALALLAALWVAAPDYARYQMRVVPSHNILVVEGSENNTAVDLSAQSARQIWQDKSTTAKALRQASFTLPDKAGISLFAPRLGVETTQWVNSIPLISTKKAPPAGPGLGPWQLGGEVGPIFLGFSPNRFDLVSMDGFGRNGPAPIWYGDLNQGGAFKAAVDLRVKQTARFSFYIGVLGLLASLIGLCFKASRLQGLVGLMVGLALLGQGHSFLTTPTLWLLASLAATLVALTAYHKQPLFAGLACCAALAGWGGLLLLLWAPAPAIYLKLADVSVTGLWPLLGIGLPLLVITNLNRVAHDFVTARATLAEKETIIQNQEAELHAAIRAGAINEERQRFVRDMHDGVGGQLLSLMMRVRTKDIEPEEVEDELQRGLHDLRLMADSLDHVGNDLDLALTAFERRAGQQCAAAGIVLNWSKNDSLTNLAWDGRQILNLFRILQEALTNCIRHSGGKILSFAFEGRGVDKSLRVTITDDGKGIDADAVKGRGLINIEKRAASLGGAVVFQAGEGGKGLKMVLTIRP
jgi:signal transduction histidine kinase